MKASERSARPRARVDGLIVKELPEEVLVYDLENHKAHCLNPAAATIWRHFDGETNISEVASRVSGATGDAVDSEVVLLALQQLRKAKLMLADAELPRTEGHLSRRDVIKRLGLAATAPLVTSILAPTAQASTSCGGTCSSSAECAAKSTVCVTCLDFVCR